MTEAETIALALEAHHAAARAQFEREGSQDFGQCGGAMLAYRGNTRFSRALVAAGLGQHMGDGVYLCAKLPADVRTQSRNVTEDAVRAFRDTAEAHGYKAKRFWTYAD
jgi:hypothetical protein